MKNKIILLGLVLIASLSGCEKSFSDLEQDPNRPVSAPASLVLKQIQFEMYNNTGRPFSDEMIWNQFYCSNYNYYGTNEYDWTEMPNHFLTLKNVVKMEAEAKRAGAKDINPYAALGKFYKAFYYDQMSKRVGDLPLTEALKGTENFTPTYDSQKNIYVQILNWLDDSNSDLTKLIAAGENTVAGDIYFGGDLKKWQKVVNAFQLRILTTLSEKVSDTDLNVKGRFAQIISNPTKYPLPTANSESLQFVCNNVNKYPSNPDNFGFDATRQNMSKAYIERLTDRKDPRVFVTAEPAGASLKAGKLPSDFTAYIGASSGEDLADMSFKAGVDNGTFAPGQYSFQSRSRYYTNYIGESVFLVGYPELCFNIAEGVHRGWATGNADEWYEKGIKASLDFYGIKEGTNTFTYSKNGGRNAADFQTFNYTFSLNDYLAQANVKYTADSKGLEQIITQKYLAFFMNSGMEGYFNWRRTGFPTFYAGVGTGNSGRIATRWQYPLTERTTNAVNYKKAIDNQFGGNDSILDKPWILK